MFREYAIRNIPEDTDKINSNALININYKYNAMADWIMSKICDCIFATVYSAIYCCKCDVIQKPCFSLTDARFYFGLNNIYSQKNTYVNTTQMVQDLTVSAALIYKSSPRFYFAKSSWI